jgi:hypothetical protein
MATRDRNNSLLLRLRARKLRNIVVREVRDRESYILGRIVQPHDGTEAGVIAAAEAATERMYCEFATASNCESRICATDASGNPRWVVAPNFDGRDTARHAQRGGRLTAGCRLTLAAYGSPPLEPRGASRCLQPLLQNSLRQN